MTNPLRGEAEVSLAGQTYQTKLNLDSIVRIESSIGSSIVKVAQKLSNGDLLTNEIVLILHQALRGGGNDLDQKKVQSIIWEAGMMEAMAAVGVVITSALTGGDSGN